MTNRHWRSQFSNPAIHTVFQQCKLSQGLAGHILFMLVSAWLVFCPFFFGFLTVQGLRGVWQMAGKWSHQCTCTNPLLMVAYPSCMRPSIVSLNSRRLVFSGLPGIQTTVTYPTGWTTPKSWRGGVCKPPCKSKQWCVTQDKVSSKLKVRQNYFSTKCCQILLRSSIKGVPCGANNT